MNLRVYLLIFFLASGLATTDAATRQTPASTDIPADILKLGSESFKEREAASRRLWAAGQRALEALKEASKSDDPEVRARALDIIEKTSLGLHPDTPPELANMIRAYQSGSGANRNRTIDQLFKAGPSSYPTLLRLLSHYSSPNIRSRIMVNLARDKHREAELIRNDPTAIELQQRLEMKARTGNDRDLLNFAAYAKLSDSLNEHIKRFETERELNPKGHNLGQILIYLYRANNNHAAATALARDIDQRVYEIFLYEQGRYTDLARNSHFFENANTQISHLGYKLTFARLAGDDEGYKAGIEDLVARAKAKEDDLWFAIEILLVNEEVDRCAALLKELERFDLAINLARNREKIAEVPALIKQGLKATPDKPDFIFEAADFLAAHNKKEESLAILMDFKKDNKLMAPNVSRRWLVALVRNGFKKEAFEEAANRLDALNDGAGTRELLQSIFPRAGFEAPLLYNYFREQDTKLTPARIISRIDNIVTAQDVGKSIRKELEGFETYLLGLSRTESEGWVEVLAARWRTLGDANESRRLLGAWFNKTGRTMGAVKVADLYAEEEDWKKAAEWYKKAWDKDPGAASAAYGYGVALRESGQIEKGTKVLETAHWLPLAENTQRFRIAQRAKAMGNHKDAEREWRMTTQVSRPRSWYRQYALGELEDVERDAGNYKKAYDQRLQQLLDQITTESAYVTMAGYLVSTAVLHNLRAHQHLADKDYDKALKEGLIAAGITTSDIDSSAKLVEALDAAKKHRQADKLFKAFYDPWKKSLAAFPDSPLINNNLAWLCAISNRKIDEAMTLSNRALELEDDNQNYVDTLAEIYFRLGNREKAVEIQKRCVELNPQVQLFKDRLKHFEESPLPPKPRSK